MHANKKPTLDLPRSREPGGVHYFHPGFRDDAPVSAERIPAQRPAAEIIAQLVRRWAEEDAEASAAQARR